MKLDSVLQFVRRTADGSRKLVVRAWRHPAPRVALKRGVKGARTLARLVVSSALGAWRHPRTRSIGRAARRGLRIALFAGVIAGVTLGVGETCFVRVPAGVLAVRQSRLGEGVEARDYGPGLYFSLPWTARWHFLPERTHYLTFANQPLEGEQSLLKVRTKDGNVARVEVTVPYRIRSGQGHQLVSAGLRSAYEKRVRAAIETVLLAELANLSSDDYASSDRRLARAENALNVLNDRLAELFVEAESVQLQGVYFPVDYEQKLQSKQLLRQETLLGEARSELDDRKAVVLRLQTEIDEEERDVRARVQGELEALRATARLETARLRRETAQARRRIDAKAATDCTRGRKEGEAAAAPANGDRTGAFAAIYETRGGRLYLANIAAASLRLDELVLDSRAVGLPLMLDPSAVVGLLTGEPKVAGTD